MDEKKAKEILANMVWVRPDEVVSVRGTRTFAGPGMYACDAEATVRTSDGTEVYVHANAYDMFKHYTVSKTSIYDFLTGNGDDPNAVFDEEYNRLADAKVSKYYKVIDMLAKVITRLERGIE